MMEKELATALREDSILICANKLSSYQTIFSVFLNFGPDIVLGLLNMVKMRERAIRY